MTERIDLRQLEWRLSGWTPHLWRLMQTAEVGALPSAEVQAVPARVPGSVQLALREAGLLPDWNLPLKWRECEWVENRHWIYETTLPDDWLQPGRIHRLHCEGLDYSGWLFLNGEEIGEFRGTHVPHVFDLTPHLGETGSRLRIVFDLPPRWLGQFGFTSEVREWKARFNYTWDWQPRLVQIGIWDEIRLEITDGHEIGSLVASTEVDPASSVGSLNVSGRVEAPGDWRMRITFRSDPRERPSKSHREGEAPAEPGLGASARLGGSLALPVSSPHGEQRVVPGSLLVQVLTVAAFNDRGFQAHELPVELWWPNGEGAQPLYVVTCTLLDEAGVEHDRVERRVGFRHIEWRPCEGAPEGADPWLCVVNGRRIFLQGVNIPPVLPNFADTTPEQYGKRLATYAELGVNTLRVNGVGFLEKAFFYDLCDELGLLVWQDVPLSSSGVDNVPPDDETSIREVAAILCSFIERRRHHACLLLWCGGNELHARSPEGYGVPMTDAHPLIARLAEVVEAHDPGRRFLPTTATGPRFNADAKDFGKGLHWNTHGPWKLWSTMEAWREYWEADDSLFRAESGAPGASPASVIREYAGGYDPMPVSPENPVWRRPLTWWIEDPAFLGEVGRAPETLEEYVDWSQARQAEALAIAVGACKGRFPRCGGILLWCGHDCHPCAANTSILDIHGDPKPAARALAEIWRSASR
jgi:beta-mannosidase